MTVLFTDLRGVTSHTERIEAEKVVAILNDHFDLLVGIIAWHGGFVVDFLGDAVFAVFEAEAKGMEAAMRLWEVWGLRGDAMAMLPSPVRDLAELPTPMEARLRLIFGKQIDPRSYPARLYRLGAAGAELESEAPLVVSSRSGCYCPRSPEASARRW